MFVLLAMINMVCTIQIQFILFNAMSAIKAIFMAKNKLQKYKHDENI